MRCTKGHPNTGNKAVGSLEYPVVLVSSEELVK
jgi:hypothetical protein